MGERKHDLCTICGEDFTEMQWADRHDGIDGSDVHEACCRECGGHGQVTEILCRHDRTLTDGCNECLSDKDWRLSMQD